MLSKHLIVFALVVLIGMDIKTSEAVGDACAQFDPVCHSASAICINNKCVCRAGYQQIGDQCIYAGPTFCHKPNDFHCKSQDDCDDPNSKCKYGICKCVDTHFQDEDKCTEKIALGNPCKRDEPEYLILASDERQCSAIHSICRNKRCTCNDNYEADGSQCKEKNVGVQHGAKTFNSASEREFEVVFAAILPITAALLR